MLSRDIQTIQTHRIFMKKLFLSFTFLSFLPLTAFEYNSIQQAIVDRNPDKLEELLKAKTLTPAEKFIYLDLAEQVILDNFLPPVRQAFAYKMTYKDTFAVTSATTISLISFIISLANTHPKNTNPLIATSAGVVSFGSFCYLLSYLVNLQSQTTANSVKIKQILLAA